MPSEKQSFVRWLEACGFPDHKVAELASKRLDIARLQPLWQSMQHLTCTAPDRAQLDSMTASVDRIRMDQADPASLKRQAQLDKLIVSVKEASQNLLKQQACLDIHVLQHTAIGPHLALSSALLVEQHTRAGVTSSVFTRRTSFGSQSNTCAVYSGTA